MEDGIRLTPGDEGALGCVVAVGEGLPDRAQPGLLGLPEPGGPRQAEDGQARVVGEDGLDDRGGLLLVADDRVVERPVRLDVAHPGAGDAGEALERTDLVDDVLGEVVWRDVDEATTEAGQVAVPDLRADAHPLRRGPVADRTQDGGVTGVEAAGDVGARDDLEQRVVVAERPLPEPLTEVGVEIDVHGHPLILTATAR